MNKTEEEFKSNLLRLIAVMKGRGVQFFQKAANLFVT